VQVRHDEGVAIRIDPKPCAVVRKGDSEASVGERIGQPLSLAKIHILGADVVAKAEGNMDGRVSASVWTARRGALGGNREILRLTCVGKGHARRGGRVRGASIAVL
jgi:hypothetical protein